MRVLFLTNFYQAGSGGEEQSCQQVVEGLKQRGHTTLVLTSMHGTNNVPVEKDGVHRALYLEMDLVPLWHSVNFFTKRKSREKHNLAVFEQVVQQFVPDVIFIWGMWNLPYSLAALAEARYLDRVVYRFASYWPTLPSQHELYWRAPGRNWLSRITKTLIGQVALAILSRESQPAPLSFPHAICVSAATRAVLVEAGVPVAHARVIHTGLDIERYLNGNEHHGGQSEASNLKLLYAGRFYPEKGIDTLIEAMIRLSDRPASQKISLTLAGSGSAGYETHLRQRVAQAGITDHVVFLGWVPSAEMPRLLQNFDALVLPSTWPEPFSRAVLEGMLSGLIVLATRTGGTPEIIQDGENGVLFTPNSPEDLALKIAQLADNPETRKYMQRAGRQTILEQFTMKKMMDEIEGYLQDVAQGLSSRPAGQL